MGWALKVAGFEKNDGLKKEWGINPRISGLVVELHSFSALACDWLPRLHRNGAAPLVLGPA